MALRCVRTKLARKTIGTEALLSVLATAGAEGNIPLPSMEKRQHAVDSEWGVERFATLPKEWRPAADQWVQDALASTVREPLSTSGGSSSSLPLNRLTACLVHPSYVPLEQRVKLTPAATVSCGFTLLRLASEVVRQHQARSVPGTSRLVPLDPRVMEDALLGVVPGYPPPLRWRHQLFGGAGSQAKQEIPVPSEVCQYTVSALCGEVVGCFGEGAAMEFLDQLMCTQPRAR